LINNLLLSGEAFFPIDLIIKLFCSSFKIFLV
jgi:hypothetical protein